MLGNFQHVQCALMISGVCVCVVGGERERCLIIINTKHHVIRHRDPRADQGFKESVRPQGTLPP